MTILRGFLAAVLTAWFACAPAQAQGPAAPWEAERGQTVRGTTYEIRRPANWNGVLIGDLDFAQGPDAPRFLWMLRAGYALAGTARRADRPTNYDPAREIDDQVSVFDLFERRFGKARRTIQFGQSGGGHVALAMAESRAHRIDAAVVACAHTPIWLMNSELDAWFVLRTLVAPSLRVIDLEGQNEAALTAAWREALTAAQATPIGRARLTLAAVLGQFAPWAVPGTPEPDPADMRAMQKAVFDTLHERAERVGGPARLMFERSVPGQISWNEGVDYAAVLAGTGAAANALVRATYAEAGMDPAADLAALAAAPRVRARPEAVRFWSLPGRTVIGRPHVPVFRFHTLGDGVILPSAMAGYEALLRANGMLGDYRAAHVRAAGHCTFSPAEIAASIEATLARVETGAWGDTSPEALNRAAARLDPGGPARFVAHRQSDFFRVWVP
ncbi:MAG: hypothetical protein NBV67_01590 [Tagaea sp.]|nr:hypothetical protein [Tagaea sp.]